MFPFPRFPSSYLFNFPASSPIPCGGFRFNAVLQFCKEWEIASFFQWKLGTTVKAKSFRVWAGSPTHSRLQSGKRGPPAELHFQGTWNFPGVPRGPGDALY